MEYTAREKAMIAHFTLHTETWYRLLRRDQKSWLEEHQTLTLMAYLARIERRLPNAYFSAGHERQFKQQSYEEFSFGSLRS